MGTLTTSKFRFRKHDRIGATDAEQDTNYLYKCFIDNGDLDVLRNCNDPRRIILGRTGSGKTALIMKLDEEEEHVVQISPEQLSLSYLSNSTILKYLSNIGVDLDLFYRLLWRHIFAVELIKERFRIRTETEKTNWLTRIFSQFYGDKKKEKAMKYLIEWGESFWEETEYRIKEVTQKFESDLKASLGTRTKFFDSELSGGKKFTDEEKLEIRKRAQSVVNNVQIKELFEVINLLAEDFFDDPKYRVYITIDKLDENWIEDRLRYRIIRALIEAIREFNKVKNSKIIIALRRDLIDRVIRDIRDTGFQEEKYRSLYLHISWTPEQLLEILNRRIDLLVREQYTKHTVTYKDILPKNVDNIPIDDYITLRTLNRPRDIIHFFNSCIEHADGKAQFTAKIVKIAEEKYSRERLRSLADEWQSNYPDLIHFTEILKKRNSSFTLNQINDQEIEDFCLEIATREDIPQGPLFKASINVANDLIEPSEFRHLLAYIFYKVGLIGLKTESFTSTTFSYEGRDTLPPTEITELCHVTVSPMFWRILGITPVP
ncbi:MAG: P-loop ATPase, Sll1717 family [Planctomycetota bacterium]|jgi:hypothetical protein